MVGGDINANLIYFYYLFYISLIHVGKLFILFARLSEVHRTVMELTDKAMAEKSTKQIGTGIKEDPAVLDENFTRQLADRMLKDLGESKEFGHIFRGLNPTHPAVGSRRVGG
jgi:hypothetical protein